MNDLLERILDLPPRQRVLALVGGVALLFFVYAYFLYWPRSAEIDEKEQHKAELTSDRDRKKAMVANLERTRKEVAQLDGDLRKAVAQLPDTKEIPDLLSSISSLGRESGLEIIQFRQRPEKFEEFYAEVPVDILVKGTYHQVAAFFDKVGHMARIVNVSNVTTKSPAKIEAEAIELDTACVATTFRFLDEAERERIAKQKEKEKGGKQ
ncbi:MAG TPA: type 4a pilus biogenesis protein PilO [Candidatus Margulisiibacteriota bacterium]|nr:type 4a pilus biogenesis protein PilO [Candidatus Margulisiibacteriota bacterium]